MAFPNRFALALGLLFILAPRTTRTQQLLDAKLVSLDGARQVLAAAEAEARRNNWSVSIAVVDASGALLAFVRMDDAHPASVDLSLGKARTAARFKRPSKAMEDMIAAGRSAFLAVEGITPIEGGVPIIAGGKVVGAVGVSGVTSQQDSQIAAAGAGVVR